MGYINQPTLAIDYLAPTRWLFDTLGAGIDGGRNGLGQAITIGLSGGPMVVAEIDGWLIEPEQHEYGNWIAARMNGSFRFMNVPIPSDFMGPFPVAGPIISGIPHSDGSLFSDGSGYSQATGFAVFGAAAALNAGEIVIDVVGASRNLRHSDWMSTYHAAAKGWRAWRFWDRTDPIDVSVVVDGVTYDAKRYTLKIDVPLREAVALGQRIELARPRCVMKFALGSTLPYEVTPGFEWKPQLRFVEAF